MSTQISAVVLGVADLKRSKKFYADLGCPIDKDYEAFVSFKLGDGSSDLGLYPREALAADAGVGPAGSGFTGMTLHYIVSTPKEVDDLMAKAESAGGNIARAASAAQWGGYFGYFSDPDGYLWKVAASAEQKG